MSTAGGEPLKQGRGDESGDAFAALYDRSAPALFRVAWTLLRSRPDAEDAVQEVFDTLESSPDIAKTKTWDAEKHRQQPIFRLFH